MTELKPLNCPFCLGKPKFRMDYVKCENENCALCGQAFYIEKWNKRVSPWRTIEKEMPGYNKPILVHTGDEMVICIFTDFNMFEHQNGGFNHVAFRDLKYKWMPIPE